jgi:hypothetical protein
MSTREDRREHYRGLADDELIALGVTFHRNWTAGRYDAHEWLAPHDDVRQVCIERGIIHQLDEAVKGGAK